MNDTELIITVRESVAGIHTATPVTRIMGRGRAVRARRRIPAVAGALAMAAGTALAVTALLPSSHSGRPITGIRLAAWTVTTQANGDIAITINQLQNPAGLQSTLRADGLPVTVSFSGPPLSASCQAYDTSRDILSAVGHYNTSDDSAYLVIDPSALPSGTGVAIFDAPGAGSVNPSPSGTNGPLAVGLVYASTQCTG